MVQTEFPLGILKASFDKISRSSDSIHTTKNKGLARVFNREARYSTNNTVRSGGPGSKSGADSFTSGYGSTTTVPDSRAGSAAANH